MTPRRWLATVPVCLLLAACGGSAQTTSSTATSGTTPSSTTTTAASTVTATSPTPTGTATNGAAAVTTTSTTSRPPEVPKGKARKRDRSSSSGGVSEDAVVETTVAIDAGGQLAPPAVSVPSGVAIDLRLADRDTTPHSVVLALPQRQTLRLSAGASATASIPALRNGTYRILVDGTPRGQLLIGAQGGP
jgi:hypothetical protein